MNASAAAWATSVRRSATKSTRPDATRRAMARPIEPAPINTTTSFLNDGFDARPAQVDVADPDSVAALAEHAASLGAVTHVIHAAGVSPVQASAQAVIAVDVVGTALVLEEFGRRIAPGGAGIVIASQAGHMLPPLDEATNRALAQTPAKDDAVAWLAAERKLIDLDTWTPPAERRAVRKVAGQTVEEFANEWLAGRKTAKGEPLKARTAADYRRYLDRHILPTLGSLPLRQLTPARVQAWYDELDAQTPTQRAHVYQLLRAIATTAADKKLIPANPCKIPGAGRAQRAKKITPATPAELAAIASNMPKRLQLAVLLGGWCALRYGEIAELRRRDIDLKRGTITVSRGVTWPSVRDPETGKLTSTAVVGTPKTAAGLREVHIPPHILPAVEAHLAEHTDRGRDAMLFASSSGHHIHPRAFGWQYHQARVKAGRSDLRFHDLRHTGAVLAAQTGATLAELMGRLGHSTPSAAMRYQHAAADRDKAIAQALSRLAED